MTLQRSIPKRGRATTKLSRSVTKRGRGAITDESSCLTLGSTATKLDCTSPKPGNTFFNGESSFPSGGNHFTSVSPVLSESESPYSSAKLKDRGPEIALFALNPGFRSLAKARPGKTDSISVTPVFAEEKTVALCRQSSGVHPMYVPDGYRGLRTLFIHTSPRYDGDRESVSPVLSDIVHFDCSVKLKDRGPGLNIARLNLWKIVYDVAQDSSGLSLRSPRKDGVGVFSIY